MIACPTCRTSLPDASRFCSGCGADVGGVAVTDPPVAGAGSADLEGRLTAAVAGRYRILKLLGQGGMGAVYLADDLELDRRVAIKVLPDTGGDLTFVERFRREARTAARLDHPNIIPIYRVESAGELHYFVMRFVPGQSLADLLADQPRLEIETARRILIQAARALGHAHRHGIVHRDVKPANFMLEADDRVVLTDFGISKGVQATANLTSTGAIIGTPSYMAPEQARGLPVDGRTDQYALGVVGFELLAGRPPFESDDVFVLMLSHMNTPVPSLRAIRPDIPADLEAAIMKAMAKDPAERFESLEEFARRLEGATGADAPVEVVQPASPAAVTTATVELPRPASKPVPRPAPKSRWPMVIGLTLIVGGAGGVAYRLQSARISSTPPLVPASVPVGEVARPALEPSPRDSAPSPRDSAPPSALSEQPPVPVSAAPSPPPKREPPKSQPGASAVGETVTRVERARITIGVDGSYATVFLDNELVGETPVVREVSFGEHEVRIEREGFKTIRQKITVNGPTTRRFTLEPLGQP